MSDSHVKDRISDGRCAEVHLAFNRHDIKAMMELKSDDPRFENAGSAPKGAVYTGKEAIGHFLDFFRELPDARMEIEEAFGLSRRCVTGWKIHWADTEGDKRYFRGADIYKVKDDLIYEKLSYVKG